MAQFSEDEVTGIVHFSEDEVTEDCSVRMR